MSQITLYLDDDTEALLTRAAADAGVSKSRWVAELIRRHGADAWPPACLALAGAYPQFPLREDGCSCPEAADIPRVGF